MVPPCHSLHIILSTCIYSPSATHIKSNPCSRPFAMEEKKKLEIPHTPVKDKAEYGLALSIPAMPPLLLSLTDEDRDALEKRLVRKLDVRLMPMSVLIYILNYLDRYVSDTTLYKHVHGRLTIPEMPSQQQSSLE